MMEYFYSVAEYNSLSMSDNRGNFKTVAYSMLDGSTKDRV